MRSLLPDDKGSTAVAPYSVRSRKGAAISMPLPWAEITKKLDPQRFTLRSVPDLILKRADPWRDIAKVRQQITARARHAVGLTDARAIKQRLAEGATERLFRREPDPAARP